MFALPAAVMAAGAGPHLEHANIDLSDKASLQRGAKLFVNYCLSCHSPPLSATTAWVAISA